MKKFNLLLFAFFLLFSSHSAFAGIDLQLNLTADKTEYNIYQKITYTLTASNTGSETATGVKISIPIPETTVFSNSNASLGSYNLFFKEWTINNLNTNSTATLELTIFTLSQDNPIIQFVQVIAANQTDSDSTPNNGVCCSANEDDEADLTINPVGYVSQEADLNLAIFKSNGSYIEGEEIIVTVRPINAGPAIATNVKVKIELPNGLTFAPNQPANVNPSTGIITIPSIGLNMADFTEIPLLVGNVAGALSIFGQIMSADQSDPDSPHGNDTDQTANEDDEDLLIVTTNVTDVSLEMEIDKDEVAVNDIVTFTLDARVNPNTPTVTTQIAIRFLLPDNLEYVSHEFSDDFGVFAEQNYDPNYGGWSIDSMKFAPPHDVSLYQLKVQVKVLQIDEPILIATEFLGHVPVSDIDSTPSSFPTLFNDPNDFIHDEEDDEAIVMLYPIGSQPASISGVTFRDGFRQGVDYLTVSKNQGIDNLTVYLYDANDLSQPIQTLETFSNDIQRRGRYHFNHLDPNKNYVVEYQNATPELDTFFQGLLPGPVQRSPFLKPNDRFSEVIDVSPDEEVKINFAWVEGKECTLNSAEADAICDDNNTPSPSDDTYNIRYTANGEGAFSVSGGITVNAQEYPNNRLILAETSYSIYPRFDTYEKWFEAELNLPVNGATSKTLTFSNDATFEELNCNETVIVPPPSSCSQLIDIELDFSIDNVAPVGFEGVTLTLVVTNTGSATAEDVEVEMYLFDNGFPDGKFDNQVATASQGSYEPATLIWNVGDIAAGQTATLDVESSSPRLIEGQTIPLFAQVTRAHGYDSDSDVNNDVGQTADEDDEGFILFGDDRMVDFEIVNFYPVKPSYNQAELVEFFIEVRNSSDAEIEMDGATVALDLPDGFVYDSYEFDDCQGNCVVYFADKSLGFFNLMPGESTSTVIRYTTTDFIGAADVFAQVASQVQGDIDSTPNNGTCCTPQEDDEAFAQVQITGDTTQEGVDLELQYEVASPTFNRWEKVDYTITIENKGTETATNMVVSTPIPTGLAFTSRTVSKGTFNLFFQTWTIPELTANETATLDLTLFTLVNSAITNFAQVKSLDQMDVDSTPNNNTTTTPQEDDEAAVTITPNSGGGGKDALDAPIDQATTLALYQLFPVPALDKLQVVFGTAGYQVNLFLYDVHGKQIRHQSLQIMRGENAIEVDVQGLAGGFYTISLETPEGFVRGKFLKQ